MKQRPNLLFVFPDEFRRSAVGIQKRDPVFTPNLDRFAGESLEMVHAVSSFPVCSPYRAQLFTGQYPWSNGVLSNCNSSNSPFGVYLSQNRRCLPDIFSDAGYDCGYIGKWHLDPPEPKDAPYLEPRRQDGMVWDAFTPVKRRHHFNFWYSYGCCDQHFRPHYWYNDDRVEQVREQSVWSPIHETDVAIDYIKNVDGGLRNAQKPFCLFVAYNPPHMPFEQVPQRYRERYTGKTPEELLTSAAALREGDPALPGSLRENGEANRRLAREGVADYFASVTGVDDQFGRLLKALEETGQQENTIVIFTSDHGEMMGSHSLMGKSVWYDDSFRIPFFICWPGVISPGKQEAFLNPPDLLPTLMELAGIQEPPPGDIEGHSLAATILNGIKPRQDEGYYINPLLNARGLCNQEWMLVTVRDWHETETLFLYDRQNDPEQLQNLAGQYPARAMEMREKLEHWLRHTNDRWIR